MKITKTDFKGDLMIVYTDEFPLIGFHIEIDTVTDPDDLINKVKIKITEEKTIIFLKKIREKKYNLLKV